MCVLLLLLLAYRDVLAANSVYEYHNDFLPANWVLCLILPLAAFMRSQFLLALFVALHSLVDVCTRAHLFSCRVLMLKYFLYALVCCCAARMRSAWTCVLRMRG